METSLNTRPTAKDVVLKLGHRPLRALIRDLCRKDFIVFQKVECGFEIGDHHKRWAERLAGPLDVCEMAPRDHGKSHSLCRAYAVWKAKYNDWTKDILILGPDQPSAVENLDKIKALLADRPSLRSLLPPSKRDRLNSRTELMLNNGTTIKAKGIGSPLRGRHPQLIIMDDVLNEKNSLDPDHRKELKNYVLSVILPMKDKGVKKDVAKGKRSQIVIAGTAQDQDDLYHFFQQNPGFVGEKMRAVLDDELKTVLWPERYSYDDLMLIKQTMGALAFSKEYLNEPINDETSLFPTSLFDQLKDRKLSYVNSYSSGLPVYMGVDFSVPGSMDGDWTVIFVMAYDSNIQTFIVLNYWRARPQNMQEQIHQIELWCQKYSVTLGYVEDNLFQKVYANHFADKSSLPISGHTVNATNKKSYEHGILSFRPLFENGKFLFPYQTQADQAKTDLLVMEFAGMKQRKGKLGNQTFHDDIIMGMWHALMASRGATFKASWD